MANKFGLGRGLADISASRGAIPDISLLTQNDRVIVKQIPLARLGSPEDIAAAVAFLASPQAAYITGSVLHVNGGMFMN